MSVELKGSVRLWCAVYVQVRVYSMESGREEATYTGHHGTVQAINMQDSPPQSFVTGASDNKSVTIWLISSKSNMSVLQ